MSAPETIRIVIADDHAMFRAGIRRLIEGERGFAVAGEASDVAGAVGLAWSVKPNVLLLDVAMPGESGLEVVRALTDESVPRIILLTAAIEPTQIVEALQLGARGVVLKQAASDVLFESIRAVMAGHYWLGSGRVADLRTALHQALATVPPTKDFGLTRREQELLTALVDGAGNRDMALQFKITEDTVKHHLASMFDKCGVSSRLELAMFAIRNGLVRF